MKIGNVEIVVFGHASVMIKGSKTVYIDPYVLPENASKADIVIFTHPHYDHCIEKEKIEKILKEETQLVSPECESANIKAKVGETKEVNGVKLTFVPAYNIGKPFHPKEKGWCGVVVEVDGIRVYHAGDTDLIPEMEELKGKVDVALLPVGGKYTMNAEEAAKAALIIQPKIAIPMHYGIIVGSKDDAEKFKKLLEGKISVEIPY